MKYCPLQKQCYTFINETFGDIVPCTECARFAYSTSGSKDLFDNVYNKEDKVCMPQP